MVNTFSTSSRQWIECNSGTLNTHKNTNHHFTLLNTISTDDDILTPFFVVSQQYAFRFKSKNIYDLLTTIDQPIYQHKRLKYIIAFNKGGSLNTDIMMEYVTRVVARDTPRHLLLDAVSIHKISQFRLHCAFKNVALAYIPANTTGILQVNDLVLFAPLREHISHMHNRLITEEKKAALIHHDVEYAAHYILNAFKRAIIPYCFHWFAHQMHQ